MNVGATQPAIPSRARDDISVNPELCAAAPAMLALFLKISESTEHLPSLYEAADEATTFTDQLIRGNHAHR